MVVSYDYEKDGDGGGFDDDDDDGGRGIDNGNENDDEDNGVMFLGNFGLLFYSRDHFSLWETGYRDGNDDKNGAVMWRWM